MKKRDKELLGRAQPHRPYLDTMRKEIVKAFMENDQAAYILACQTLEAYMRKCGIWSGVRSGVYERADEKKRNHLGELSKERWRKYRERREHEEGT
jgi:hypothetical protein